MNDWAMFANKTKNINIKNLNCIIKPLQQQQKQFRKKNGK